MVFILVAFMMESILLGVAVELGVELVALLEVLGAYGLEVLRSLSEAGGGRVARFVREHSTLRRKWWARYIKAYLHILDLMTGAGVLFYLGTWYGWDTWAEFLVWGLSLLGLGAILEWGTKKAMVNLVTGGMSLLAEVLPTLVAPGRHDG